MDGHVNDLYTFNVTSKSWQGLLPFENEMLPLQPRAETQAACYKGGAVYIFGGYTMRELGGYRYYDDGVRITHRKEGELRWTGIKPFDSSAAAAGGVGRQLQLWNRFCNFPLSSEDPRAFWRMMS